MIKQNILNFGLCEMGRNTSPRISNLTQGSSISSAAEVPSSNRKEPAWTDAILPLLQHFLHFYILKLIADLFTFLCFAFC